MSSKVFLPVSITGPLNFSENPDHIFKSLKFVLRDFTGKEFRIYDVIVADIEDGIILFSSVVGVSAGHFPLEFHTALSDMIKGYIGDLLFEQYLSIFYSWNIFIDKTVDRISDGTFLKSF